MRRGRREPLNQLNQCEKVISSKEQNLRERATILYKTIEKEKENKEEERRRIHRKAFRKELVSRLKEVLGLIVYDNDEEYEKWDIIVVDGIRFTLYKCKLSVNMKCICGDYYDHRGEGIKSLEDLGRILNGGFFPTDHYHYGSDGEAYSVP